MSCDVGEVTERLENEELYFSSKGSHTQEFYAMGGSPGELSEDLVT